MRPLLSAEKRAKIAARYEVQILVVQVQCWWRAVRIVEMQLSIPEPSETAIVN